MGDLAAVGEIARRFSSSASGVRPQPQTGRSGGQMQPSARAVRNRLTRLSSSEWKEMAERRPPDADLPGQRERALERAELVVDRDADRLEGALGGVAAAEAGGCGNRLADRLRQLSRRVDRAAADDLGGDPAREPLLPYSLRIRAIRCESHSLTIVRASSSCSVSIRMSSGAS